MDVLSENVVFTASQRGRRGRREDGRCRVLSLNFRKLKYAANAETCCEWSWEDLLHSVAGLCSVCLPDMELSAIYSSLTAPGTRTVLLVSKEVAGEGSTRCAPPSQRVVQGGGMAGKEGGHASDCKEREDRCWERVSGKNGSPPATTAPQGKLEGHDSDPHSLGSGKTRGVGQKEDGEEEEEVSFAELFSASEESDTESDSTEEDEYAAGRGRFLAASLSRRRTGRVGPEHGVAGCVTVLRLSSKSGSSAVQISLLVVRRGWRRLGAGSYLLQCSKDPDIVGHYDVLLVFADHKAEGFFSRHGFTDDPIITSGYKGLVDPWDNSTLMAYLTPFSGPRSCTGSLKSLTNFEDHYREWRLLAIASYCGQLSFMERLRHEVLLLHTKVQSQEEVIVELSRELRQVKEEQATVEGEFGQYRKRMQRLLCEAAVGNAERWMNTVENTVA